MNLRISFILAITLAISGCKMNNPMIVVELSSGALKLQGKEIKDLEAELNKLRSCENLHILADRSTNPDAIFTVLNIAKAKCKNVSIQSV